MTNSKKNRIINKIKLMRLNGLSNNSIYSYFKDKLDIPDNQLIYICFNSFGIRKQKRLRLGYEYLC